MEGKNIFGLALVTVGVGIVGYELYKKYSADGNGGGDGHDCPTNTHWDDDQGVCVQNTPEIPPDFKHGVTIMSANPVDREIVPNGTAQLKVTLKNYTSLYTMIGQIQLMISDNEWHGMPVQTEIGNPIDVSLSPKQTKDFILPCVVPASWSNKEVDGRFIVWSIAETTEGLLRTSTVDNCFFIPGVQTLEYTSVTKDFGNPLYLQPYDFATVKVTINNPTTETVQLSLGLFLFVNGIPPGVWHTEDVFYYDVIVRPGSNLFTISAGVPHWRECSMINVCYDVKVDRSIVYCYIMSKLSDGTEIREAGTLTTPSWMYVRYSGTITPISFTPSDRKLSEGENFEVSYKLDYIGGGYFECGIAFNGVISDTTAAGNIFRKYITVALPWSLTSNTVTITINGVWPHSGLAAGRTISTRLYVVPRAAHDNFIWDNSLSLAIKDIERVIQG